MNMSKRQQDLLIKHYVHWYSSNVTHHITCTSSSQRLCAQQDWLWKRGLPQLSCILDKPTTTSSEHDIKLCDEKMFSNWNGSLWWNEQSWQWKNLHWKSLTKLNYFVYIIFCLQKMLRHKMRRIWAESVRDKGSKGFSRQGRKKNLNINYQKSNYAPILIMYFYL